MGKDVRFEIIGDDVQLDRQIVDLLREPLRHLLGQRRGPRDRRSVGRVAVGKSATGVVRIAAREVDEGIEVSVSDDGAGSIGTWWPIAEVADHEHTIRPVSRSCSARVLDQLTPSTDFSGTGEGLAAARDSVERVHGVVHIESIRGRAPT